MTSQVSASKFDGGSVFDIQNGSAHTQLAQNDLQDRIVGKNCENGELLHRKMEVKMGVEMDNEIEVETELKMKVEMEVEMKESGGTCEGDAKRTPHR